MKAMKLAIALSFLLALCNMTKNESCTVELKKSFETFISSISSFDLPALVGNPIFSTGTNLGDVGKWSECVRNDNAYLLAHINISDYLNIPHSSLALGFLGLCLPKICKEPDQIALIQNEVDGLPPVVKNSFQIFDPTPLIKTFQTYNGFNVFIMIVLFMYILFALGFIIFFINTTEERKKLFNLTEENTRMSTPNIIEAGSEKAFENTKDDTLRNTKKIENTIDNNNLNEAPSLNIENSAQNPQNQGEPTPNNDNNLEANLLLPQGNPQTNQNRRIFDDEIAENVPFKLKFDNFVRRYFNFEENLSWIFERQNTEHPEFYIFDGALALAVIWIAFCQTKDIFKYTPIRNYLTVLGFIQDFLAQFIMNSSFAIDILLAISAFYLAFYIVYTLRTNSDAVFSPKKAGFSILMKLLKVYPVYLIVFLFFWRVVGLWIDGPLIHLFSYDYASCQQQFPFILTFLYDFSILSYGEVYPCIEWYYFICIEVQLTIVFTVVLVFFKDFKKMFWAFVIIFAGICLGVEIYLFNTHITGANFLEIGRDPQQNRMFYSIFNRFPPFVIGIVFGVIYAEYKSVDSGRKNFIQKFMDLMKKNYLLSLASWIIGNFLMLFICFVIWWSYSNPWKNSINILYNVGSRYVFIFGFFLVIMPILLGNLKILSSWLASKLFTSIGNNYMVIYIINPIFTKLFYLELLQVIYFEFYYILFYCIAFGALSIAMGYLVAALCEVPYIKMAKDLSEGRFNHIELPRKTETKEIEIKIVEN